MITPNTLTINIDESSINRHIKKNYSWCLKGRSSEWLNSCYSGSTSIVMAVWSNGTWTAFITNTTINSEKFLMLIEHLEDWLKKSHYFELYDVLLIMDNWSIHKTTRAKNRLSAENIKVLFLPWYTPQWVPIESLFGIIKNKLISSKFEGVINLSQKKNYNIILDCMRSINSIVLKKLFAKMIKKTRINT